MPLYDGRECPSCLGVIFGRHARKAHRQWHHETEMWHAYLDNAVRQLLIACGIPFTDAVDQGPEPYQRVQVSNAGDDDYDDQEDDDDDNG